VKYDSLFVFDNTLAIIENLVCMNAQKLDWNELRIALAVCREGSLSGAARQLGVNHSTVYRRVQQIEDKIGVRLFERLPFGYVMTEAGEEMLAAGERIEEEVNVLSRKLIGRDLHLSGTLRVTAPDALSLQILIPHLAVFRRVYPSIQLELTIRNSYLNLSQSEADIAIRATSTPPETLVGRQLGNLANTVYVKKRLDPPVPGTPLDTLDWLMPDESLSAYPAVAWLYRHHPDARVVFRSNTLLTLHEAAKQGMGAAVLPCFLADPDDDLARLLEPPKELTSEIWLLTHPDLRRTARVRALMEFLADAFQGDGTLINGKS